MVISIMLLILINNAATTGNDYDYNPDNTNYIDNNHTYIMAPET